MDLLAQYADSDDEKNDQPQAGGDGLLSKLKMSINAAPVVKDDIVVCIIIEAISRGIIYNYQKFKIIFSKNPISLNITIIVINHSSKY